MIRQVCLFVLLSGYGSVWAQAKDAGKSAPDGKAIYQANCLSCHGEKGDGMGPAGEYLVPKPRNFKADRFKNGDSLEAIAKTINDGLPNTPMVGFKGLTPSEQKAVAAYVKSLRGK